MSLKNCDWGECWGAWAGCGGAALVARMSADRRRENVRRIAPNTSCALRRSDPERRTGCGRERAALLGPRSSSAAATALGAGAGASPASAGPVVTVCLGRFGNASYTKDTSPPGTDESDAGDVGVKSGGWENGSGADAGGCRSAVLRRPGRDGKAMLLSLTVVDGGVTAA